MARIGQPMRQQAAHLAGEGVQLLRTVEGDDAHAVADPAVGTALRPAQPSAAACVDAAGIAWYANYFRWFEDAEEELFAAVLGRSRQSLYYHLGLLEEAGLVVHGPSLSATDEPVAEIRVVGNKTIPTTQILNELQSRVGRPFDPALVQRDVRKLKDLGLTISLGTGYRLSPRGAAVLAWLRDGAGP